MTLPLEFRRLRLKVHLVVLGNITSHLNNFRLRVNMMRCLLPQCSFVEVKQVFQLSNFWMNLKSGLQVGQTCFFTSIIW